MLKQPLRLLQRRSIWLVRDLKARQRVSWSCKHQVLIEKKDQPIHLLNNTNTFTISCRSYAKSRDKKKEKKKKTKFDENELKDYFDLEKLLSDIGKPLEVFKDELIRYATLRSSAGAIENLKVEFEGDVYTIQDLAEIGKKNQRIYVLDFSSFPKVIPTVMNTFQNSELNFNVQQDGTKVYVPLPKVTKEHREVLAKKCKLYFIKCKEGIRDVQMRYIKSLGSTYKISVEEKFRLTDQLTALGDQQILIAEEIMKGKQEELLKIDEGAQN